MDFNGLMLPRHDVMRLHLIDAPQGAPLELLNPAVARESSGARPQGPGEIVVNCRNLWLDHTHDGSVCMPYMATFTINIPPMLASIYHTYGSYGIYKMMGISCEYHGIPWGYHLIS